MDNAVRPSSPLWAEHGLAFLLESEDGLLLLDTGESGTVLLHNLKALSVQPRQIKALVLSHAHADHTGGLEALLREAPGLPIYAHPDIARERFSRRGGEMKSRGLRLPLDVLTRRADLHLRSEPAEVIPGVWTTGEITDRTQPEGRSPRHFVRERDAWMPDPYRDDMSLALQTDQGMVVVCGCCHAGLLNTLAQVRRTFKQEIRAVMGGTHLVSADDAGLEYVIHVLRREYDAPVLYPNHCTGDRAYRALVRAFGERVLPCPAGTTVSF